MSFAKSLVPQIRAILESSDLSQISAKGVRKQLIAKGHNEATIKANRGDIDAEIEKIYEALTADNAPSPTAGQSSARSPSPVTIPQSSLPEPLAKPGIKAEPSVKPEMPSVAEARETDEEMAARLQREFDTEPGGSRSSRNAGTAKKKKTVTKKRKSKAILDGSDGEGGDAPKKRRGGGGGVFNKELILSDALSALVGEARLSRPQTVKKIWEYVKARDLQDATDKRYILCDAPLKAVFHTDRLHMFTMNKILVDHVRDPDDIAFKDHKPDTGVPTIPKAENAEMGISGAVPRVKAEGYANGDLIDSEDDSD